MPDRSENTRQFNIRISPELYGRLTILAALKDVSASELGRILIEEGIQHCVDEVPEIQLAFDGAEKARAAIAKKTE